MTSHRHIWGCRGRPPRPGDLCLCCPATWAERGRSDYQTDAYPARTRAHRIHRVSGEAA